MRLRGLDSSAEISRAQCGLDCQCSRNARRAERHNQGGTSVRLSRRVTAMLAVPVLGALTILSVSSTQSVRAFPADQLSHGEQVWNNVCSTCHGPDSTNNDAPLLLNPGTL